uniref:Caltractin n=1 Tax=Lygus hesperus TaxID=30085 RepID=A0A0A9WNN5_LYGHE
MAQRLIRIFALMDVSNDNELYTHLVRRALNEHFNLTNEQILYILTSDYTLDNTRQLSHTSGSSYGSEMIAYRPFAFSCLPAVQYFLQTNHKFMDDTDNDHATVHGLTRNDVECEFLRIFRLLDESGSGRLPYVDFCNALRNAPFHLTQRDIRIQCLECDHANDSDEIDYESEIPHFFNRFLLSAAFDKFDNEDV